MPTPLCEERGVLISEIKGEGAFGKIPFLLQISEKQRSLYEALERQRRYQDALQGLSAKMEAIELRLGEQLEPGRSPESQMAEHQVKRAGTAASCLMSRGALCRWSPARPVRGARLTVFHCNILPRKQGSA